MSAVIPIGISALGRLQAGSHGLAILEALLPVRFVDCESAGVCPEACVAVGGDPEEVVRRSATSLLFVPLVASANPAAGAIETEIRFAADARVPFPFRGRTVRTSLSPSCPLVLEPGETPLASTKDGVLWAMGHFEATVRSRCALGLPGVDGDRGFVDVFGESGFLPMLAMLEFLRGRCSALDFRLPPLRATFIVDDPNLHRPRYGFVDYRNVVEHARRDNYHVAFAMIPLDTWYTHRPTADVVRDNPDRISLLIHGNNHSRQELARPYTDPDRAALLQQAIERITRFERRTGLSVSRVMVPPHGACSSKMLAALPRAGFVSACISAGSLRAHNHPEAWTRTAGHAPSEVVAGCAVLPRWGLGGRVETSLLLAAYLGQPMIVRGHHQDLRDGPDVFGRIASFVNGLGEVHWSDLAGLCKINHQWRLDGSTMRLRTLGTAVRIKAPRDATRLVVEDASQGPVPYEIATEDGARSVVVAGASHPVQGGTTYRVARVVERHALSTPPRNPRTGAAVVLRRLLTEARDRLLIG